MNTLIILSTIISASLMLVPKTDEMDASYLIGNPIQVFNFFNKNIDELKTEYNEANNSNWRPTKVTNVSTIFNDNAKNASGYLVSFDIGYLAYSLDLSILSCDTRITQNFSRKEYCKTSDSIGFYDNGVFETIITLNDDAKKDQCKTGLNDKLWSVTGVTDLNNFVLYSCVCPIPFLMQNYPSVEFGNWLPLCMHQEGNTCSPCAFSNLIYMYKEKGLDDLTMGLTPIEIKDYFGKLAGTTEEDGTLASNIHPAMSKYLETARAYNNHGLEWKALAGGKDDYPSFYNYHYNGEGHSAIRIGTGQSDYWWFFKSYWRIVVSWGSNYEFDENTHECTWVGMGKEDAKDKNACIYVIDAQYEADGWTIQL